MPPPNSRPTLTLDVDRYQSYLDDPALTPERRHEMLQTIWSILTAFIDLGFDVAPEETCGEPAESPAHPATNADVMLNLVDQFQTQTAQSQQGTP